MKKGPQLRPFFVESIADVVVRIPSACFDVQRSDGRVNGIVKLLTRRNQWQSDVALTEPQVVHRTLHPRRISLLEQQVHQWPEGAVGGPRIVDLTKRRLLNHV